MSSWHAYRRGVGTFVLVLGAYACGSRETTATRSAAAYDEAQSRGAGQSDGHGPTGSPRPGQADGYQHGPAPAAPTPAVQDMQGSSMSSMARSSTNVADGRTPEMDHSKMDHSSSSPPSSGHSPAPPGVDHSKMPGMAHSTMGGMDHSAMGAMAATPPRPEPTAASAAPGQPAITLRPDELDSPAPTSVEDSKRAESMNAEMAGGHGQMGHGTYKHLDAGREGAPAGGRESHQAPKARPSPKPDPKGHEGHQPSSQPPPSESGRR